MPFNQSVYKRDYKPPSTFKFSGTEGNFKSGDCACLRKAVHDQPCHLPPYISGKLKLNKPEENKNEASFDCENAIQIRVWKILKKCHPEIFDEVQGFTKQQLIKFLTKQRVSSVYQKDFCTNKNRFIGESENKRTDVDSAAVREQLMKFIHSRRVKPEKFDISECAKFANAGRSVKEKEKKYYGCENHFSEYMEGISKLGCQITKNNLHNHSKCRNPAMCQHFMSKPCKFKNRWV